MEETMPLDGTGYEGRVRPLDKIDRVTDLLSDPRRWCKKRLRTLDGRYCLLGAMRAESATSELMAPLLLAIAQVTGRSWRIEEFNDHPLTTHALVVKVLGQARENILAVSPAMTVGSFTWPRNILC
jgi:hypothetical protein